MLRNGSSLYLLSQQSADIRVSGEENLQTNNFPHFLDRGYSHHVFCLLRFSGLNKTLRKSAYQQSLGQRLVSSLILLTVSVSEKYNNSGLFGRLTLTGSKHLQTLSMDII